MDANTAVRTVEIKNLQEEEEAEQVYYYLEDPKNGGGDIEKKYWNETEKIFYITFVDPGG